MQNTVFQNLYRHLNARFLMHCWKDLNKNAASGVDKVTAEAYEQDLGANIQNLAKRLKDKRYRAKLVRRCYIPKENGKQRPLGIPTVADRIAQMVAKIYFEPKVEPYFLPDLYGYRPGKSAIDAVAVTHQRCWQFNWLLEFDIKGLFDNIDHDLLMRAVKTHTNCKCRDAKAN